MRPVPHKDKEQQDDDFILPKEGSDEVYPDERSSQRQKGRYSPYKRGGHNRAKAFSFSSTEIRHIFISYIAISLAFGLIISRTDIPKGMFIAAITVGAGFILHELSHKYLALKYGCHAEFRAFFPMLIMAVALALVAGVVFAAPGAVFISGMTNRKDYGKISLAGPVANMVLAVAFLLLGLLATGFAAEVGRYGFMINSWLALFNLIPFGFFDGSKVLAWNKTVYGFAVGFAFILAVGQLVFAA